MKSKNIGLFSGGAPVGGLLGVTYADIAMETGMSLAEVAQVVQGLVARRVLYESGGLVLPNTDVSDWLPRRAYGEPAM
jgi:hypothetical protein